MMMPFRFFHRIFTLGAVLACAAWPAQAVDYTVRDVEVSATAADATSARMNAMTQAETDAFKVLLEQLLPPEAAMAQAGQVPPHQISRMVRGYEVKNEQVGATSYAATLDVAFDPAQVQAFLNRAAAPAAAPGMPATTAAPTGSLPAQTVAPTPASVPQMRGNVLVLPVLRVNEEGEALLWETNNIWRGAWNRADRTNTPFIRLPIGDQSDMMMVDAKLAAEAPYENLGPIAERYQAGKVIVAVAYPTVAAGVNALGVTLRRMGGAGQVGVETLTYELQAGEEQEALMQRAAQDVIRRIQQEAQPVAAAAAPQALNVHGKITVLSRLSRINDWVVLRKRLSSLPQVERVELAAISGQQADMVVHFKGGSDQLEAAMRGQGLAVNKSANYWVVGM